MPFATAVSRLFLPAVYVAALGASVAAGGAADKNKPTLTLRATPVSGFAPLRVVLTAALVGGPNDYEEFYCPTIEWDWGDGTKSESKVDCDPYEAGKSEIVRNYRVNHTFNLGGEHSVRLRLKQKNKTVVSASVMVRVQPGIRDGIGESATSRTSVPSIR